MKKCKNCHEIKELNQFVKHKECKDGHTNCCKRCKLELQKISREVNHNNYTKKYEKTKKGFLMRVYRNMQSRITGIQYKKHHLYNGKELLDKDQFYKWSLNDINFNKLFDEWESKNYPNKLSPSIDRINSVDGYKIENMQWITHSENSKKASMNRHKTTKIL